MRCRGTFRFATVFAAFLFAAHAFAADKWAIPDRAPKALDDVLAALKASNGDSFFSQCSMGDNMKAVALIRAGDLIGEYFLIGDRRPDGSAVLLQRGEFSLKNGVTKLSWSGPQAKDGELILGSLVRQPFRLLLSTQTDIVFKSAATADCAKPQINK